MMNKYSLLLLLLFLFVLSVHHLLKINIYNLTINTFEYLKNNDKMLKCLFVAI